MIDAILELLGQGVFTLFIAAAVVGVTRFLFKKD